MAKVAYPEPKRLRRAASVTAGIFAVGLAVAACGGPSAASNPTNTTSRGQSGSSASRSTTTTVPSASKGSSSPSDHVTVEALKFAQCMRAHGVSDYPDPRAPGSTPPAAPTKVGMAYLGDSFDPNTPTFQAGERACQKYAVGLATRVTPAGAAEVAAKQLKYAQCMRAHGVPGFPDPSANGGFTIPNSVDQNSSFFQDAERACKNFLPGLAGPPGG